MSAKLVYDTHETDTTGSYLRSLAERELVTNACFLQMFIALEEFFEAAFVHYAIGRMSTARWRPAKYMRPPTVDHAHLMLVGTQRYVDWSTPDTVRSFRSCTSEMVSHSKRRSQPHINIFST